MHQDLPKIASSSKKEQQLIKLHAVKLFYSYKCSAPLESVSRKNTNCAKLPSLQFASIVPTHYTVSLYALTSAIVCNQIENRVKTHRGRWRQVFAVGNKGHARNIHQVALHTASAQRGPIVPNEICNSLSSNSQSDQHSSSYMPSKCTVGKWASRD
jgi:hypothetical protein